jgi:hypothetical protein
VTHTDPEAIERALRQLIGVEAARVCMEGDEIAELHIAAMPGARAKHIARDVRSYLAAALGVDLDHKRISIAVRRPADMAAGIPHVAPAPASRIQFHSVDLHVEGMTAEVQVRLTHGETCLTGSAEGVAAALSTERLVLQATLAAAQRILREDVRLVAGDLAITRLGRGRVVIVQVTAVEPRSELQLVGACRLTDDRLRAVVFATLAAINRVSARLMPAAWTEVRVDPGGQSSDSGGHA